MGFPFTCQLQVAWRPCVRGIFVAIGIAYSTMCLYGNVEYGLGRDSSDFDTAVWHLRRAGEVFPLNHGFRLGVSYYFMFLGLDGKKDIEQALRNDPNAFDPKRYTRLGQ